MKQIRNNSITPGIIVMLLMMILLGGCVKPGIQIVPVPTQDALELNSDEVVIIMKRVGFSDMQIRKYGWEVWDGLARLGRVEVRVDNAIEAIFAIRGDEIYISSRSWGYSIYNINTGWVDGRNTQNPPVR